jgi:phosphonopyruvate decarboxylase
MQNSGLGNLVNPLTSFSLMYKIPLLLVIGWRGYGGAPNDAPEHWIMGDKTSAFLDLLDMPYAILEPEYAATGLDALLEVIEAKSVPGALLVRAGVIT